jgi:hypothetical protein
MDTLLAAGQKDQALDFVRAMTEEVRVRIVQKQVQFWHMDGRLHLLELMLDSGLDASIALSGHTQTLSGFLVWADETALAIRVVGQTEKLFGEELEGDFWPLLPQGTGIRNGPLYMALLMGNTDFLDHLDARVRVGDALPDLFGHRLDRVTPHVELPGDRKVRDSLAEWQKRRLATHIPPSESPAKPVFRL